MNITSKIVGGKTLVLDQRNNYGFGSFKGTLVKWTKKYDGAAQYYVVVKPSDNSVKFTKD